MSETAAKRLTVGQVADAAGVGIETIRFYEREGLIPEAPRTPAGYRQYAVDTVERLRFIQRAKESLTALLSTCPGQGGLDGCPILVALTRPGAAR